MMTSWMSGICFRIKPNALFNHYVKDQYHDSESGDLYNHNSLQTSSLITSKPAVAKSSSLVFKPEKSHHCVNIIYIQHQTWNNVESDLSAASLLILSQMWSFQMLPFVLLASSLFSSCCLEVSWLIFISRSIAMHSVHGALSLQHSLKCGVTLKTSTVSLFARLREISSFMVQSESPYKWIGEMKNGKYLF